MHEIDTDLVVNINNKNIEYEKKKPIETENEEKKQKKKEHKVHISAWHIEHVVLHGQLKRNGVRGKINRIANVKE